eukprot:211690_1
MEKKEAEAVKQSKTDQIKNQEKKEEKKNIYLNSKKKWNQILKEQPIKRTKYKKSAKTTDVDKKSAKASSKLIQIENQEKLLKREIERGLDRKDGDFEYTQKKMKKLEKFQ